MAEFDDSLVTVALNSSLHKDSEESVETSEDGHSEKVTLPTLVSESTLQEIPPNLLAIIQNLSENGGSSVDKTDLIVSVFFVLMLETGFVPKGLPCNVVCIDFHKQRLQSFTSLPPGWKMAATQSYTMDFILQPFPEKVCKMLCVCLHRNINVNIIIDSGLVCVSEIRVPRYIVSEEAEYIPLKFRNLRELSIDFKNNISNVAKSAILRAEEITDAILQDMPSEILYNIFTFLRVKDFLRLSCTCQRLRECANYFEDKIWKLFIERDFPNALEGNGESVCKWKEKYKLRLNEERKREKEVKMREQMFLREYGRNQHFY